MKDIKTHLILDELPKEKQEEFMAEAKALRATGYWKWFIEDLYLWIERYMLERVDCDKMWWEAKGALSAIEHADDNVRKMANAKKLLTDSTEKKKMHRIKSKL